VAQLDAFLVMQGIQGESQDRVYKDAIQLNSFSWGMTALGSQSSPKGGSTQGRVAFQNFHFTCNTSRASAIIAGYCTRNQLIPHAKLILRKAGDSVRMLEYVHFVMSDCTVLSYHTGAAAGGNIIAMDQVVLEFPKIHYTCIPQRADGGAGGGTEMQFDVRSSS
jgi:type VI secretion system secreted protein Hcp